MQRRNRAVFLDRDGTLVKTFLGRPANNENEIELLPSVAEGLVKLAKVGLMTVVVSNQGGVGLGYMAQDTVYRMGVRLDELLKESGAPPIGAYYYCTHKPSDGCECRKPRPGMILKAEEDFALDLENSYLVGDMVSDIEAAVFAGIRWPMQVLSDASQDAPLAKAKFSTFVDAVDAIVLIEGAKR